MIVSPFHKEILAGFTVRQESFRYNKNLPARPQDANVWKIPIFFTRKGQASIQWLSDRSPGLLLSSSSSLAVEMPLPDELLLDGNGRSLFRIHYDSQTYEEALSLVQHNHSFFSVSLLLFHEHSAGCISNSSHRRLFHLR